MRQFLIRIIVFILCWFPVSLTVFWAGSNWHIASVRMEKICNAVSISLPIHDIFGTDFLIVPRIIKKQKLNILDALINILALLVTSAFLMPVIMFLVFIIMFITGIPLAIASKNWMQFVVWAVCILSIPLHLLIFLTGIWLIMLFEPCTAGYFSFWLAMGIPAILAGLMLNIFVYQKAALAFFWDNAKSREIMKVSLR
ncbi:MAG: hypothetical protein AB7S75_01655 [Desulfococcaceae bacterium]